MKIRFLKNVTVDMETHHGQIYDKAFYRWQELRVQDVYVSGNFATIQLDNGDVAVNVPSDAFEKVREEKRTLSI